MANVPKDERCWFPQCNRRRAWIIRWYHSDVTACNDCTKKHGQCSGIKKDCDQRRKRDGNTGESCGYNTEIPMRRIQGR